MERRLKERRNSLLRERGRRRGVWLGCLALLVLAAAGWFWLRSSKELAVDHIVAPVTERVRAADIEEALEPALGGNLVRLSTRTLEGNLRSIPYVREAHVYKRFPNGLEVRLEEYVPFARILGRPDEIWAVADDGRVLELLEPEEDPGGPVIVPGQEIWPEAGEMLPDTFSGAVVLTGILKESRFWGAEHPVARLLVDTEARITMVLGGGAEVRMGDPTDLEAKLAVAEEVVRTWLASGRQLQYVDVQVWDRPVAMPRSS